MKIIQRNHFDNLYFRTTKLRTFPEYLMVHIKKFTLGDDWVPKKLNANLQVPDIINLSYLRGYGLQPGEEQLPAPSSASSKFVIEFSKSSLNELMEMGFSLDACKRALYSTSNSGVEAATNWIMEHMTDPDFNDPFTLDNTVTSDQVIQFHVFDRILPNVIIITFQFFLYRLLLLILTP